jgi:hypothetical protein
MITKKSDPQAIIDALAKRLRTGTTSPLEALAIANEVGRDSTAGAIIHKAFAQSLLEDVVRGAGGQQ